MQSWQGKGAVLCRLLLLHPQKRSKILQLYHQKKKIHQNKSQLNFHFHHKRHRKMKLRINNQLHNKSKNKNLKKKP